MRSKIFIYAKVFFSSLFFEAKATFLVLFITTKLS